MEVYYPATCHLASRGVGGWDKTLICSVCSHWLSHLECARFTCAPSYPVRAYTFSRAPIPLRVPIPSHVPLFPCACLYLLTCPYSPARAYTFSHAPIPLCVLFSSSLLPAFPPPALTIAIKLHLTWFVGGGGESRDCCCLGRVLSGVNSLLLTTRHSPLFGWSDWVLSGVTA